MRLVSLLAATACVLASIEAKNVLNPKGPPCPEGDGLYAVGCSNKYLQCVNNVEHEQSCPDGLYFDRLLNRCERRQDNHLCRSTYRALNVRQKAIKVDCEGRLNGDYPLEKGICSKTYYQCANGAFYMRSCPHNQVYVAVLKRCDYASTCESSNGVKNRAAAAYASPTYDSDNFVVTTKEFENGYNGIDCIVQGDLFYAGDGECSPYFFQCSNGKLFRKTCPQGLIYVFNQNLCDYPTGVKGCPQYDGSEPSYIASTTSTTTAPYSRPSYGGPVEETPVDPLPYSPAHVPTRPPPTRPSYTSRNTQTPRYTSAAAPTAPIYVPPQAPTMAPYVPADAPSAPVYEHPVSYQPAVHGDCENKGEGIFEIKPCFAEFLSCSSGVGRVVRCAGDLVFDQRITACDYLETCRGPRHQEDVPNQYNHGGAYDGEPAEIKVDFDCAGKTNGDHVKEACTTNYFRCQDGRAFAAKCPSNLVYNRAISTCDYVDNCDKNYVEPSKNYGEYEQPAPTVGYEAPTVYTTQPPRTVGYTQPARDTERPSTIYSRPVYTKKPTTVGYEGTTPAPYTQAPVTLPEIVDDFSCTNIIDGNHASGLCKSLFYTCSNNILTATKCPADLVFNPYIGNCDFERNVRDCQGYAPEETTTASYSYPQSTTRAYSTTTKRYAPIVTQGYVPTTTPGYAPTATQGYGSVAPVTPGYVQIRTTVSPHNVAFCERLDDGNYGYECEKYFFKCHNFVTYKNDCPQGLYYSFENNRCDYEHNVRKCPGYIPTTTTPAADEPKPPKYGYIPDKYPNIDYTTTTPGPVDTTPIAAAFSCYGRPDGIYALPYCSKDYVQCINGRSLIASCASGLFYSENSGLCDYKQNVKICQIRKGSDIISTNACTGKADGYYSAGCSSHYFSCIEEKIRKMECPNKLKFSEKTGVCTYPNDIVECSISKPDRAPPAVPSDFCTRRPSGLHAFKTCSPHYVVCDNNRAILGTCATPLTFNGHNQLCDYKANNQECGNDYVAPPADSYNSYTTPAQEQPTTTTKPYQPPTPTRPYYKAPTTTRAYEQPTTTTTTTTVAYEVPTTTRQYYKAPTTTRAYQQPTTTTSAQYEAPTTTTRQQYSSAETTTQRYQQPTTTTTAKPYQTVATTTPARDVEVPTTTVAFKSYEETTTTPARDVTTTTVSYAPSTHAQTQY